MIDTMFGYIARYTTEQAVIGAPYKEWLRQGRPQSTVLLHHYRIFNSDHVNVYFIPFDNALHIHLEIDEYKLLVYAQFELDHQYREMRLGACTCHVTDYLVDSDDDVNTTGSMALFANEIQKFPDVDGVIKLMAAPFLGSEWNVIFDKTSDLEVTTEMFMTIDNMCTNMNLNPYGCTRRKFNDWGYFPIAYIPKSRTQHAVYIQKYVRKWLAKRRFNKNRMYLLNQLGSLPPKYIISSFPGGSLYRQGFEEFMASSLATH